MKPRRPELELPQRRRRPLNWAAVALIVALAAAVLALPAWMGWLG